MNQSIMLDLISCGLLVSSDVCYSEWQFFNRNLRFSSSCDCFNVIYLFVRQVEQTQSLVVLLSSVGVHQQILRCVGYVNKENDGS